MRELTKEELTAKIAQAEKDILQLRSDGVHSKQAGVLEEYIDYLKDQLKDLDNGNS